MIIKEKLKLVDEPCCMCEKLIPKGSMILRLIETGNIICVLCLIEIAEAKI